MARAAAAAAGARRRGADRARAGRRAAAGRRRRPRRAVVRLPVVRRGARAEGPRALRLGPRRLRADLVVAQRRRGRARAGARAPPTGRSARSTSSTAAAGTAAGSTATATTRRSTCRPTGRRRTASRTASRSPCSGCAASDVVGAGTTLDVDDSTRPIEPGIGPGEWESAGDLRNGDSYRAAGLRPAPDGRSSSPRCRPRRRPSRATTCGCASASTPRRGAALPTRAAQHDRRQPAADTRRSSSRRSAASASSRSPTTATTASAATGTRRCGRPQLSRTWALSKRLRAATTTPYEYVLAVSAYLRRGFTYTEKPARRRRRACTRWSRSCSTPRPATASTTRRRWRCCCAWAASRRGWRPASPRAATPSAAGPGSCATPTPTRGSRSWFDGFGWVTVDPTPSATPARSQIAALAAPSQSDAASAAADAAAAEGDGATGDSDPRAAGSREELFNRLRGGSGGTDEELGDDGVRRRRPAVGRVAPLALLLCAGAGVLVVRRRRRAARRPARAGGVRARDRAAPLRPRRPRRA